MTRINVNLARDLRRQQTDAERLLWSKLRDRQVNGVKFRRQYSIGTFIADFVSLDIRLVIEVDGGQHNEPANIVEDQQRTKFFEGTGYKVLRFWNNDVLQNIDGVIFTIKETIPSID